MDRVDLRSDTVTHPTEQMYRQMVLHRWATTFSVTIRPSISSSERVPPVSASKRRCLFRPARWPTPSPSAR